MQSIQDDYVSYIKKNIQDKKAVLLFFNATWCNPCKKVKEIIQPNMASIVKNNINVLFIDIDTNIDSTNNVADYFSLLKKKRIVRGVPSLLLYINNNEDDYSCYPDYFCDTNPKHIYELLSIINKL